MDSISGHEFPRCWCESQPNNASNVGMNGWIPQSKRQSGHVKSRRSCFILPKYSQVNGELLHQLLIEHPCNVLNNMKNYWIWYSNYIYLRLKEKI